MEPSLYQDVVKPYALDEAFGELMDQSQDVMPQELPGKHKVIRAIGRKSSFENLGGRVSRLLMQYLGQFCMVDLYGGCQGINDERANQKHQHQHQHHPGERSASNSKHDIDYVKQLRPYLKTRSSWPWWSQAIRFIYFFCFIKALVTVYYQYCYDFNLTRYERLKSYLTPGEPQSRAPKFYVTDLRRLTLALGNTTNKTRAYDDDDDYDNDENDNHFNQIILSQYETNFAHAKWMLKLLGAPYMHMRFSIECTYLFFLLVSLGVYVQTQLFFTYIHPFDYALVRSILDFKRELSSCNKSIRKELNKFIESSRVFTCIVLTERAHKRPIASSVSRRMATATHKLRGCGGRASFSPEAIVVGRRDHLWSSGVSKMGRALENHSRTIEHIERMALNGALMPANKQPNWVCQLARANCVYTTLYLMYCLLLLMLIAWVIPGQVDAGLQLEPMDVLASLELLLLVIVINTSSTFWGSILLVTSLDQVHLVRELKLKFDQLLRVNSLRVRSSLRCLKGGVSSYKRHKNDERQVSEAAAAAASAAVANLTAAPGAICPRANSKRGDAIGGLFGTRTQTIQAQMDGDMLELVLSYKIFVAQLGPMMRSYGFVTVTTYTLMILMPVIGRVHVPYVNGRIKIYVGALSLLCTLACDLLILIPVSYLNARCIELHKSLSGVLAHTIEVSQARPTRRCGGASGQPAWIQYNEHTVYALRKELRHTDGGLADQFASNIFGIRLTYSNLLKIHFWIGFITQSFLFESSVGVGVGVGAGRSNGPPQDLIGSIFADPLGLH